MLQLLPAQTLFCSLYHLPGAAQVNLDAAAKLEPTRAMVELRKLGVSMHQLVLSLQGAADIAQTADMKHESTWQTGRNQVPDNQR